MPAPPPLRAAASAYGAPFALLLFVAGVIWLLYGLALPGRFLLDDQPNLEALTEVQNWVSALGFVFSGHAGPLGRPISLASFAWQATAWPDQPAVMLRLNFLIHLSATAACFTLAAGLARLRIPRPGHAPLWIGLAVATLWGLSPFLALTHLMVIQRMTSLAGFFVLSGLAAFVWAHLLADTRPRLAGALLVAGLGLCAVLATLSKESGALLPLLALAILWLWIPMERRLTAPLNRYIILLLAVVPAALLLGYLAYNFAELVNHGYGATRYFTLWERLLTQPSILLDYLRNLLLPRAIAVSPYMDRLPVSQGWLDPPMTFVSFVIWAIVLVSALRLRRAAPYLLFGVAFFLVGHLLESGFIGLELYFAHRNYVPAFGIYFGLVFAAVSLPENYRRVAVAGLLAYALMFSLVLFQVTSSWNQTQLQAQFWMQHNPYSQRAAQFLAAEYLRQNHPVLARRVWDSAVQRNPDQALFQIERTKVCAGAEDQFPELLQEVLERLPKASYEPNAAIELARSARGDPAIHCAKLDHAAIAAMADALLANPAYADSIITKSTLLLAKAFTMASSNESEQATALAMQAYQLTQDLDTGLFTATIMTETGQPERARRFLEEMRQAAPEHPLKRAAWLQRIDGFFNE